MSESESELSYLINAGNLITVNAEIARRLGSFLAAALLGEIGEEQAIAEEEDKCEFFEDCEDVCFSYDRERVLNRCGMSFKEQREAFSILEEKGMIKIEPTKSRKIVSLRLFEKIVDKFICTGK
jgi:hypothetical protein